MLLSTMHFYEAIVVSKKKNHYKAQIKNLYKRLCMLCPNLTYSLTPVAKFKKKKSK